MIEDQEVELDGRPYVWSCDPTVSAKTCWIWTDRSYMAVPQSLVALLNRQFIDNNARELVVTLNHEEQVRFCEILIAMGATDEELVLLGMKDTLFKIFPEKEPSKFITNMPPATHLPSPGRQGLVLPLLTLQSRAAKRRC